MLDLSLYSFEQALQELEGLVRKMEEGRLPLEDAITSYEKGMLLKKYCEQKLKEAQLRVEQITLAETGEVTATPFPTA